MCFKKRHLVIMLVFIQIFSACGTGNPQATAQVTATINVQDTTIGAGESQGLSVSVVSSADVQFEWSTTAGNLSDPSSQSVIFTAPNAPGPVVVDVKVISGEQVVTDSITFNVAAPEPTETPTPQPSVTPEPSPTQTHTPTPTSTPTATAIPEPIACSHRSVAPKIFPQLAEDIEFSFAGPEENEGFECMVVYDRVRIPNELAIAVKLEFEVIDDTNFAFFGMSIPGGYDVSDFDEICFWVYSEMPDQVFEIQVKDTEERLFSHEIVHEKTGEWQEHCSQFDNFSSDVFDSINWESILDFTIGFNDGLGNATIWIDDFELK